jgi:predicted aspartyl protease
MPRSSKRREDRALEKAQRTLATEPAILNLPYDPMQLLLEGPIIFTDLGVTEIHSAALRHAGQPVPPKIRVRFLLDTGADSCVIRHDIAERAGLKLIETGVPIQGVGVDTTGRVYMGRIWFGIESRRVPGASHLVAIDTRIFSGTLPSPRLDGLIGRDVLRFFEMTYNGKTGHVRIKYFKTQSV